MAGHSHFANIKHKKGANDAKRAKILTKISRELSIAIKGANNDPKTNPKLRLVLEKARINNIPKENLEKLLNKKEKDMSELTQIIYEGYGPFGSAILVDCLTDNINRTIAEVRHIFSRNGGKLGVTGEVSYMFERKGIFIFEKNQVNIEKLEEIAILNNASDIFQEDNLIIIECEFQNFLNLQDQFNANNLISTYSEIKYKTNNNIKLTEEQNESFTKFVDFLEDLDDVQNVFSNVE